MRKVTFFLTLFILTCLTIQAEESLQQYAAKYKFPPGSALQEVNVVFENGVLHLNSSIGSTSLEKIAEDQFYMPGNSGKIVFVRNEMKKITGVKFDMQSISIDGTKEEKETELTNPVPVFKSTFPIKYLPVIQSQEEGD